MILLDTHTLVWLAFEPEKLSAKAAQRIRQESAEGKLAIAAITCWELALMCARRRVEFTGTISGYVERLVSFTDVLPMTPAIVAVGAELPATFPKDPADRMIAATAIVHAIPLITKDAPIRSSGVVEVVW